MLFTPQNPPKSGESAQLWKWVVEQTGSVPDRLWVNRPGRHQRAAGACHYGIELDHNTYLVWSVSKTLTMRLDDARRDRRTRDMLLA